MAFQQKPNRGSLFRNDDKSKDEDRDYSGSLNVEGRELINETKTGTKYLSLSVKPKEERDSDKAKPKGSAARELNDSIPF